MEARRHHADDGALTTANGRLLADDGCVCAEAGSPKVVAENDNELVPDAIFLRQEEAAEQGLHAERGEECLTDELRLDLFGLAVAAGEVHALISHGRHVLERRALLLPIEEVRGRDDVAMVL